MYRMEFINVGIFISIYMTIEFHKQKVLFDTYMAIILVYLFYSDAGRFCFYI